MCHRHISLNMINSKTLNKVIVATDEGSGQNLRLVLNKSGTRRNMESFLRVAFELANLN